MAQVKFYRGLGSTYTQSATTNPTIKEGIYFSMDEKVLYHNGVKFGGIDPQYFGGVTKDFDIEGNIVSFKKLNNQGGWDNVTITLVEAGDSSVEIGSITKNGVTDGVTVKVKTKDVGNNDGLKLHQTEGLYVDLTKTTDAIAANQAAIEKLNGDDTVDGSVANKIKVAIDGLDVNAMGGDGKVITTISQADGKVSATAIDLTASNVKATESTGVPTAVDVTGETVSEQIASLATSIKTVSTDAKTYSITAISGEELTALGTNVKEAYKLVDEDGAKAGEIIKIYKDSSLKSVALVGQMLNFTYILADGSESTVGVDVSTFLAESEFKDGLEVVNGNVKVKIAEGCESFLTVDTNGVKLSGVQDAINTAAAAAKTKVEKKSDADKITLASATTEDGSVTYTIGQKDIASAALLGTTADDKNDATAFGKIAKEVDERKAAVQAQTTALNAEIAARKAVDGVDADAYAAKTSANYISDASSLFDADVKLDAAIKTVADNAAKAHTKVNAKAGGHVRVAVEKSTDGSHDVVTVSENDIASADALNTETNARVAQDNKIEAAVGLAEDGTHVTTSGFYTSGATTVVGEIAALDTKLKEVSDTLQWINCGNYGE